MVIRRYRKFVEALADEMSDAVYRRKECNMDEAIYMASKSLQKMTKVQLISMLAVAAGDLATHREQRNVRSDR